MTVALVGLSAAIMKAHGLKRKALLEDVMITGFLTAGDGELDENGIMLVPK